MSLAQNDPRRHHQSDDLHFPFSSTIFSIPSYSNSPNPSNLDSPDYSSPADFYHESGDSTPSEQYIHSPRSSPYMTTGPSQNPPIRVQSSTPNPRPSQTSFDGLPPMQADYSAPGTNWDYSHAYHLTPQYQQQQHPATAYRSHKRFSSGSSVGSVGPDSPYTQSTAFPYIVDSDSVNGSSPQLEPFEGAYSSSHYPKISSGPSYYSYENLQQPLNDSRHSTYNADSLVGIQSAIQQAMMGQNGAEATNGSPSSRNPYGDGYDERSIENRSNVPKFSRTMTDVYADELFEPSSSAQPAPVTSQAHQAGSHNQNTLLSPYSGVFSERLLEANQDHISQRSNSPTGNVSRGKSPFREGSEYLSDGYSTVASTTHSPATRLTSAAQMREQAKAESDAIALAQHQPRNEGLITPKTISPKEALLDYNETEEDAKMPLFPQENRQARLKQPNQASIKQERNAANSAIADRQFASTYPSAPAVTQAGSNYQFMPPSMPGNTQLPQQQYPFLARRQSSIRSTSDTAPEFPAHLTSMDSTKSEGSQTENRSFHGPPSAESSQPSQNSSSSPNSVQRPQNTAADSGTYACTAQACSLRFHTASELQKHRRDTHRQPSPPRTPNTPTTPYAPTSSTQTPSSATFPGSASSSTNRNNQAGPHKCERINPSTGKPCNTIFSRSYDLTRHEDTIHNNRKQKVRCQLCTEDKTFSRNDALTRHMRVVHPDVDFPGKTRRRGG